MSDAIKHVVGDCLSHATDLLAAARSVHRDGLPNISYHLAALCIEEIGKAELHRLRDVAGTWGKGVPLEKYLEDHTKKLFWALWSPSFGKEKITKAQIDLFSDLARKIHEQRQRGMYAAVDVKAYYIPKEAISEDDAVRLMNLAENRLNMAKLTADKDLTVDLRELIEWYLTATDDVLKRKLILGQESLDKLVELGDTASWIRWLRNQFDTADKEAHAALQRELARERPTDEEASKPKWSISIRLFTQSHSIRPKALAFWNNRISVIRLHPVDKRKKELDVKLTLAKAIPIHELWNSSLNLCDRFILALNIGSMGFFWWDLPKHVATFDREIIDLDTQSHVGIRRSAALELDWGTNALSDEDLSRTMLCLAMLPWPDQAQQHEPFLFYQRGLALMAKNDIHFQVEPVAFDNFYSALKSGLRAYGDWNGIEDFASHARQVLERCLGNIEELHRLLSLKDDAASRPDLNDVANLKSLCDGYFFTAFKRLYNERQPC